MKIEIKNDNLVIDGKNVANINYDDTYMDDSGNYWICPINWTDEDGDDRLYQIIYYPCQAWIEQAEDIKRQFEEGMDPCDVDFGIHNDESYACDWDVFEVKDESGTVVFRTK